MKEIELTDDTIILRPFKLEYAEDHLAGDDSENIKWLSGDVSTLETVRDWIIRNQESWANDGPVFNFAIFDKQSNKLVGMVEANSNPKVINKLQEGEANISYSVYPFARGRGYATKAVTCICTFLKSKGFHTALIRINPENKSSLGVPLRSGFIQRELITTQDGEIMREFSKRLN